MEIYTIGIDVTFATPARIDFCRIICESAESDDNDIRRRVIDSCMVTGGSTKGSVVGIEVVGVLEDEGKEVVEANVGVSEGVLCDGL